jgi:hypothetical protein
MEVSTDAGGWFLGEDCRLSTTEFNNAEYWSVVGAEDIGEYRGLPI